MGLEAGEHSLEDKMAIQKERRKFKRRKVIVTIDVEDTHSSKDGRACVVDISRGDIGIESSVKFQVGDHILLKFKHFTIKGLVKRICDKTGTYYVYGIQFEGLGFFDRKKIGKLIEQIA